MNTKLKSLYLEDRRIKKMYANGNLLYQGLIKPIFSLSTDSIIVGETGETFSFSISANDSWTITKPENITLSSTSGYGDTTITGYATGDFRTGTINVTCYEKTLSITVNLSYETMPLTFEILSDGVINWCSNNNTTTHRTIQYSKNGGSWTNITSSQAGSNISVVTGDIVQFKGDYTTYSDGSYRFGMFGDGKTTCNYNLKGNIMSLINSTNFATLKSFTGNYTFRAMFNNCSTLKDISKLVLPATGLTTGSYRFMFQNCSSLIDLSNLVLPATTAKQECYYGMFNGCTGLTKAPALPATTLAKQCYMNMFNGCTSLTQAPSTLPATSLTQECYRGLFYNCSNLKNIKCMAQSGINSSNSTTNWVSGVAATGTFTKKSGVNWPTGNNGIPSGWTVIQE